MEYLYHGSSVAGITGLEPRGRLHGTDKHVVYLTDNIPCALFYIWDGKRIGYGEKHVTGGIRNGIAFYEEQFPGQLAAFYQGASGYLYHIPMSPAVRPLEGREGLFYSPEPMAPIQAEYVPDVYQALLEWESRGRLEVRRYADQPAARRDELVELIARSIVQEDFCRNDPARAAFLRRYFAAAWERALARKSTT